ncbi:MBL fold metallo-hydrolase [Hymenobacter sp. BT770]|uniref:MBL fold metallo-hydrolase n=1 Tax=Hymenobacter sp. BT770 TaxID=2886942 RepID=UPI001D11B593|nr:MBL fold metallo-hydrolase [Hymenobacter sp. BT770]MCC3154177.1 MBL fold metallo-hydrolase [Hymenobacter sp. BT770]MDO3414376.1 MBL fold metallo-hydrolase [Hymenobacter sp. BT770]
MKQISDHLYQVSLGIVNVFLLQGDGLTLIDTGVPGSTEKVLAAIRKGGKNPEDIRNIVLTHWHPDHAGNAAELKQRFKARVYAHAAESDILEQGGGPRPRYLTPGLVNWVAFRLFIKGISPQIAPVIVDEQVQDGDVLPLAGGLRVVHTPGHSAGHMALLVEPDGVLIAGDICANASGLDYSIVYEDLAVGRQSILKAADLSFDQAVFGHGGPVTQQANAKLKARFQQPNPFAGKPLKPV